MTASRLPECVVEASSGGVTVVVATYNGALFVERQLESICSQSLAPSEIIVTDDGSDDDTLVRVEAVLRRWGGSFRMLRNPGDRGYSNNFLHGACQANSRFIAFSDQDDVWHTDKLEVCVEEMMKSGALVCSHGARLIDERGGVIGRFWDGPLLTRSFEPNSTHPWFTFAGFTLVFRSCLLRKVDPGLRGRDYHRYHQLLSHDSWITILGAGLGQIRYLSKPLADYRQHDRNLIGARRWSLLMRLLPALGPVADASLNRSAIARRLAKTIGSVEQERAGTAVQRWMRISALELARLRMYAGGRLSLRITRFLRLILSGAYLELTGGLGLGYLPKDALAGVLRLRRRTAGLTTPS